MKFNIYKMAPPVSAGLSVTAVLFSTIIYTNIIDPLYEG